MNDSWFTARAVDADDAEITIFGEIGSKGITAKDFSDQLKALGDVSHINVRLNSPGGDVFAGNAIHSMLMRHKASVSVTIDGVAASIASVIAMAGDAVIMPSNSLLMLHDPSGNPRGTSRELRAFAGALDKAKKTMISAYVGKTGRDAALIAEMMDEETWLTAEEAVEFGFADSIEAPVKMAAHFDLSEFKNPPEALMPERSPAATAAPCPEEESPMTDTPENGAATEEAAVTETTEATPTAPVAEPATETTAQIEARIRKESADIMAACSLVGKPEKASEFIAKSISLSDVVAALQTERATTAPEVSARKPQTDKALAVIDTMAVYAKWNGRRA